MRSLPQVGVRQQATYSSNVTRTMRGKDICLRGTRRLEEAKLRREEMMTASREATSNAEAWTVVSLVSGVVDMEDASLVSRPARDSSPYEPCLSPSLHVEPRDDKAADSSPEGGSRERPTARSWDVVRVLPPKMACFTEMARLYLASSASSLQYQHPPAAGLDSEESLYTTPFVLPATPNHPRLVEWKAICDEKLSGMRSGGLLHRVIFGCAPHTRPSF